MGRQRRLLIATFAGLVAGALIVTSGRLELAMSILIPLASLGGALALVVLLGPARGGSVALILMATLSRYTAELGGASLKPEHIAVPVVAIALVPGVRRLAGNLNLIDWLLLAWLCWSVVGGLLNAPDRADSTRLWLMLLLVAFPYFVIVTTTRTAGRLNALVLAWVVIGSAAGLFGIVSHFMYAWDVNLGIQINPVTFDPTVAGTFRESNLFGSAMAMLSLTAGALLLLGYRYRLLCGMAALVGFLALQVSFTRTAWIAFVVAGLLLAGGLIYLSSRGSFRFAPEGVRAVGGVVAVALVGTLLVWMPLGDAEVRAQREGEAAANATEQAGRSATATADLERESTQALILSGTPANGVVPTPAAVNPDIVGRVGSISDVSDSSLRIRLEFAEQGLRDWRDHPLVGSGIGSFGQRYTTTSYDRAWLSNIFVRVLHDGGIVGLLLFLSPLLMLAVSLLKLAGRVTGDLDRLALALGVAIAGMFVAFQATEGFQLAWYWAALGLFAAALRLAHARRARLEQADG
jgi:hypothetical protein